MLSNCRSSLEAHIVSRLGQSVDSLGQNSSRLLSLLNDSDADIRACAIDYLTIFHKDKSEFAEFLKRLAVSDPSTRVRDHAAGGLVTAYVQRNDEEIKSILYHICINSEDDDRIRKAAYLALVQIDEHTTRRAGFGASMRVHLAILSGKSLEEILDLDTIARIIGP